MNIDQYTEEEQALIALYIAKKRVNRNTKPSQNVMVRSSLTSNGMVKFDGTDEQKRKHYPPLGNIEFMKIFHNPLEYFRIMQELEDAGFIEFKYSPNPRYQWIYRKGGKTSSFIYVFMFYENSGIFKDKLTAELYVNIASFFQIRKIKPQTVYNTQGSQIPEEIILKLTSTLY